MACRSLPTSVTCPPHLRRHRRRAKGTGLGFTLIETALAIVIVGTGVLSIMAAQQAYHRKNMWAQRSSTGMLLAQELRELVNSLPAHDPVTGTTWVGPEPGEMNALGDYESMLNFDDVDDFAGPFDPELGRHRGMTFNPPINAARQQVADLDRWTQRIRVVNVLPDNVSVSDALAQPLGTTSVMRVHVSVFYREPPSGGEPGEEMLITELTWLVSN